VWVTRWAGPERLTREHDLPLSPQAGKSAQIVVDPTSELQEIVGFGAALTDSSAFLLRHRLASRQRRSLMRELFGVESGIGLSFLRLTIGSSDFSLSHYSLDDVPPGREDPELTRFSIRASDDAVLPLVRQALAINPRLKVMASPWSAPAWMKTSGNLVTGRLRADRYGAFAEYLSRYVQACTDAGVPIYAITLQNEPHFEPGDYPGMRLDTEARRRLIGEYVGPLFARRHPATRILEWDHNWDEPEAPLGVLGDQRARSFIAGVAWHCYRGDVSAQTVVHDAHPDKETYLTECSGGSWEPADADPLSDIVRTMLIGGIRGWAKGVLLWNLALDERFGPHAGGCTNCRPVVTIDSASGALTRNPEYFALAHFSRFVRPGARRLQSTPGSDGLDNVAFRNGDDGSIVVVVANAGSQPRRFAVGIGSGAFAHELPPRSVATYVWAGAMPAPSIRTRLTRGNRELHD
jgi:glucosylceramidase